MKLAQLLEFGAGQAAELPQPWKATRRPSGVTTATAPECQDSG
jgi:hypothetical protein